MYPSNEPGGENIDYARAALPVLRPACDELLGAKDLASYNLAFALGLHSYELYCGRDGDKSAEAVKEEVRKARADASEADIEKLLQSAADFAREYVPQERPARPVRSSSGWQRSS